jgi:hypothetical protein
MMETTMAWPEWTRTALVPLGTGIATIFVTWLTGIFNERTAFEQKIAIEIVQHPDRLKPIQEGLVFLCVAGLIDDDRGRKYLWIIPKPETPSVCGAVGAPLPK